MAGPVDRQERRAAPRTRLQIALEQLALAAEDLLLHQPLELARCPRHQRSCVQSTTTQVSEIKHAEHLARDRVANRTRGAAEVVKRAAVVLG